VTIKTKKQSTDMRKKDNIKRSKTRKSPDQLYRRKTLKLDKKIKSRIFNQDREFANKAQNSVLLNRDDSAIDKFLYKKRTLLETFQIALKKRI
jgi:hypothetical protein